MRFWRKKKPPPQPRFDNLCPACGWDIETWCAYYPKERTEVLWWLPEEQALRIICPSCSYRWKRLAEEPERAFVLESRFQEKEPQ